MDVSVTCKLGHRSPTWKSIVGDVGHQFLVFFRCPWPSPESHFLTTRFPSHSSRLFLSTLHSKMITGFSLSLYHLSWRLECCCYSPWIQNIHFDNSNGVLETYNGLSSAPIWCQALNLLAFANPAPKWDILSYRLTNDNMQSSFQRHITVTPIWASIGDDKFSLIISMTAAFWI